MVSASEVLRDRTGLDVTCLDRVYVNGYVPNLQVGSQVSVFMTGHLGLPVPSPAILEKRGALFRQRVEQFAQVNGIPVIQFSTGDRKQDVTAPYINKVATTGRAGVAVVGIAQEYACVFQASKKTDRGGVWFSFFKQDRRVTCYYFYVWDHEVGPGFVKICTYFPYPMKIWINGHEWAKQQATRQGLSYRVLANGFAACDDPDALQRMCDSLSAEDIQGFADRWLDRLPLPLDASDRAAG